VHLVGFIIRKFVTMHGHLNVKFVCYRFTACIYVMLLFIVIRCFLILYQNDNTTVPTSRQQTIVLQFQLILSIYNLGFIQIFLRMTYRRGSKHIGVLVF